MKDPPPTDFSPTLETVRATEVRFPFGRNWRHFLRALNEKRIAVAEQALQTSLQVERLDGRRVLDLGSGSGLSSLAARRLGSTVCSVDFDPDAVACAHALRDRFFPGDPRWTVRQGSAIDPAFMAALGTFDIVYSWGVLHHTGAMWTGVDLACRAVAQDGLLMVALYNDHGRSSRAWRRVKRTYNRLPRWMRPAFVALVMAPFEAKSLLSSPLHPHHYVNSWRHHYRQRGMSRWHDMVDWVGGYPYEVARPEEVVAFCKTRGLELVLEQRAKGLACNEFVFARVG